MKFIVSSELFGEVPKMKIGCLLIKNIKNDTNPDYAYQYLCQEVDKARIKFINESADEISDIKVWREAFRKLGLNPDETLPSHNALFRRILERKDLPNINPIVNITNGISIKHVSPFGAHNTDAIKGDIYVRKNTEGLQFHEMTTGDLLEVTNEEVVYSDDEEVLTRGWINRQGNRSKVTENVTNIFIPIDVIGKSDAQITEIAEDAVAVMKELLGEFEASFEIVSAEKSTVDLDTMSGFRSDKKVEIAVQEIKKDREIIDRILNKAVEEILPSRDALESLLLSGRRIKVYQGFDPTADTLHIGHTVMMRKLEDFRKLGHEVFMLIGDFTARIGDPTDKGATRTKLTPKQVAENLKLYKEQASAILDIDNKDNPVTVVFNNDWLGKMDFAEILDLCSEFTVQQMLKRDMFQKRVQEDKPIFLHEFLYPLMQGWDSVQIGVDIELGGNDQLFNMLAGRDLVRNHLNKEKFVMAGKLLTTVDGKKMGKSEGNMVKLSDSANEIYGKVMAFPDEHIVPGFELLTRSDLSEVSKYEDLMKSGTNPIELKKELAYRVTAEIKGEEAAKEAQRFFEEVFQKKNFNVEIPEVIVKRAEFTTVDLLTECGLAQSKSEARRLIDQGAVVINEERIKDWQQVVTLDESGKVIKVGKKVARVVTNI